MTTNLYAAETWDKVYTVYDEINFVAYDYETVKLSLLDNLKLKYPESFNDYIESSQMIAIIESFAYMSEQLAYRQDMIGHENVLSTARRKDSVLKWARALSYNASRNLPLRGFLKIDSISISENYADSQGNSLSNKIVKWGDTSNPLWKEQFITALNRVLEKNIGSPNKAYTIDGVSFQLYNLSNVTELDTSSSSFQNGVLKTTVSIGGDNVDFEIVPSDVDSTGVFERAPDPRSSFSIIWSNDGYGDGSPLTGALLYLKQGDLNSYQVLFDYPLANRTFDLDRTGINDIDVWLHEMNASGEIIEQWNNIENINGENLAFNTTTTTKNYEIETLENDKIRIIFGAGDYSDIPIGIFKLWARSSLGKVSSLEQSKIKNQAQTFSYYTKSGDRASCTITYSLINSLQNGSDSENIEHIRSASTAVYGTQARMVNGQDYNTFPLQDPSIIHLKAVNRTFSGQPKYIDWNDPSGSYQTVKLFGEDGYFYYNILPSTASYTENSRSLIDNVIEPLLKNSGVGNLLGFAAYTLGGIYNNVAYRPRTWFTENISIISEGIPVIEKTLIQGSLDRHWYGEPKERVSLGPDLTNNTSPKTIYGVVDTLVSRVYDQNLKMVVESSGVYTQSSLPGSVSGLVSSSNRQKLFGIGFNPIRPWSSGIFINPKTTTIIPASDSLTFSDVQQISKEEVFTIEFVENGVFTVVGSITGVYSNGIFGDVYDNGILSFIIAAPSSNPTAQPVVGDSYIIQLIRTAGVLNPTITKTNLLGRFEIVNESELGVNPEIAAYSVAAPETRWIFLVERVDDSNGTPVFWRITHRSLNLILESLTTSFWHDPEGKIIDRSTGLAVRDSLTLLKSNIGNDGITALGTNLKLTVVKRMLYPTGEINRNAISVTPTSLSGVAIEEGTRQAALLQVAKFFGASTNYVYFQKNTTNGISKPIPTTPGVAALTYVNDISGNYSRRRGRTSVDFAWMHYAAGENLIDPSPSNIIDMFILTRGYWDSLSQWLINGGTKPLIPTTYELKNSYSKLLTSKMISDTVILHHVDIKLLFGYESSPELRAKFKVIKSGSSSITSDELKTKVLGILNSYFQIDLWTLGEEFFATDLISVIHSQLIKHINSVVIVPENFNGKFGDLFNIKANNNEILHSCAQIEDIIIIDELNESELRQ